MRYPPDHKGIKTHFAQGIKDRIEVHQDLPLGYFGDIIQAFRGEVSHTVLHVCEAVEERIYKFLHVWRDPYTEGDCCPSQPDQTSVPNMERIGGVAEHLDELIHNLTNALMVSLLIAFSCKPRNQG